MFKQFIVCYLSEDLNLECRQFDTEPEMNTFLEKEIPVNKSIVLGVSRDGTVVRHAVDHRFS